MKPLIVLMISFGVTLIFPRIVNGKIHYRFSGLLAMSLMLLFTALGHFIYTDGMTKMLPEFMPLKKELVYFTGLAEAVAAIGLLFPRLRRTTAVLLIIFFILVMPANIYAALNQVNYTSPSETGPGPDYLWFRVPLQIFFISWVYYWGYRKNY